MATNVVSAVRTQCAKAIKAKDAEERTPAAWATLAGFQGSAASPLRDHMARSSNNGCGRKGRYPKVTAEAMLDLLDQADAYHEAEGAKREAIAKRISNKLRPAAKAQAKATKTRAARKAPVKA